MAILQLDVVTGTWVTSPDAPPIQLTPQQEIPLYERAIQEHMDALAKAEGFDSLQTVIDYAEEPAVQAYQVQGRRFRRLRSLVWAYAKEQLGLFMSGQREKPTIEALIAELPKLGD